MAITTVTAETELRRLLADLDGEWWNTTDASQIYQGFLFDRVICNATAYTFHSRGGGLYTAGLDGEYRRLAIWPSNSTTPFTDEAGANYTFYQRGLKIYTANHVGGDISVAGALMDWNNSGADMLIWLAVHMGEVIARAAAGTSTQNGTDVSRRLVAMANQLRGARGI